MQPTRRALLGYGALLACPSPTRADDLKDGRFRDEIVTILRGLYPAATISTDDDPEQVHVEAYTLYLGNLHGDLRGRSEAERQRRILAFLTRTMPGGPYPKDSPPPARTEPFAAAQARLRIQLVPPDYATRTPDLVTRPFSKRLLVAYALDEPNRYQLITIPMLTAWGIEAGVLDEPARRNSEAEARQVSIEASPTGATGRFATSATEDGYAASRLLLPGFMERVRKALGTPGIIVAAPTREFIIAWTPDSEARARIAKVVRASFHKGPYSRSDELFHSDPAGLRSLTAAELADHGR
ncbi:DUF1444 family protein [Methylobacterium segetis]|uniref:DUF1444 family protein n=1 Tax=Methylobacterium segetis TaxID=2488750 RepID=UPI001050F76F|nr:DUF1444 family protein [Methylobacterium segetis]